MKKYAFWNNKGGVGKTFLCFMIASQYALDNPNIATVVIDMCPQANISEILLGGNGQGSDTLDGIISKGGNRETIGGYFDKRLSRPDERTGSEISYFLQTNQYAPNLPRNLYVVAGDPSLELQVQSINQLASVDLPENRWKKVHSWLIDLQDSFASYCNGQVAFFIDCNPSFATYTAQSLLASTRLIVPCTADGASARAFDNIAQLVYGYNIPKSYESTNLNAKARVNNMSLPNVHLVIFNRYTMNRNSPASGFKAMNQAIQTKADNLKNKLNVFTPGIKNYVNIPDAHTVSIVSTSLALPLQSLKPTKYQLESGDTQVQKDPLKRYQVALQEIMGLI